MTLGQARPGPNRPEVSAIGLGCIDMAGLPGERDEAEPIATIRHALYDKRAPERSWCSMKALLTEAFR